MSPENLTQPLAAKTSVTGKDNSGHDYSKRIVRALRLLTQYLDTHSRQLLINKDVTVPQVMCLGELYEKGSLRVNTLAHNIHLSASTTVGIIDRLEKKLLVKRRRDTLDRRSVFIDLTELGRSFYIATPHLLHNRLNDTLQNMKENAKLQIADVLEMLVGMLK